MLHDKSLSKEFSNFFDTAMKNLYLKGHQVSHVNENSDLTDINLNKYVHHASIFKIKEYFTKSTESKFSGITPIVINKEIKNLDSPKKDWKISQ